MRVEICEIESVWDDHVRTFSQEEHSFLQSWGWGEAQLRAGNPIARFLISDERGVCAVLLCVAQRLFVDRRVLLAPRGPLCRTGVSVRDVVFALSHSTVFQQFVKRTHAIILRIEPEVAPNGLGTQIKDVEPAHSWMVPLHEYTEESAWSALKQKTRYNIRLAQKHGVGVEAIHDEYSMERIIDMWKSLSTHTIERHGIEQHSVDYYRAVCTALHEADMLEVVVASLRTTPIAMAIGVRWGNTVTYLYGASDHTHRALMAPSLLQWFMISRAIASGYAWYDFYGVAPDDRDSHPLAGVTRFKKSFVGVPREYPGTFEIPLRPLWYSMYQWIRTLRRLLRP